MKYRSLIPSSIVLLIVVIALFVVVSPLSTVHGVD